MIRSILIALAVALAFLAFTNPTETQFRAHVQEREGIGGWLGLKLADLLSTGPRAGIRRENFIFASRFLSEVMASSHAKISPGASQESSSTSNQAKNRPHATNGLACPKSRFTRMARAAATQVRAATAC